MSSAADRDLLTPMLLERHILLAPLAVVAFLWAACSAPPDNDDHPEPVGNPTGKTVRELCEEVIQSFCDRQAACSGTASADCVPTGRDRCCEGAGDDCEAPSSSSGASIDRCVSSLDELECESAESGELPAECQGAVRPSG